MDIIETNLKPCPFCGSTYVIIGDDGGVYCTEVTCGVEMAPPVVEVGDFRCPITAWNTRTPFLKIIEKG
jgi:hypothetical protein